MTRKSSKTHSGITNSKGDSSKQENESRLILEQIIREVRPLIAMRRILPSLLQSKLNAGASELPTAFHRMSFATLQLIKALYKSLTFAKLKPGELITIKSMILALIENTADGDPDILMADIREIFYSLSGVSLEQHQRSRIDDEIKTTLSDDIKSPAGQEFLKMIKDAKSSREIESLALRSRQKAYPQCMTNLEFFANLAKTAFRDEQHDTMELRNSAAEILHQFIKTKAESKKSGANVIHRDPSGGQGSTKTLASAIQDSDILTLLEIAENYQGRSELQQLLESFNPTQISIILRAINIQSHELDLEIREILGHPAMEPLLKLVKDPEELMGFEVITMLQALAAREAFFMRNAHDINEKNSLRAVREVVHEYHKENFMNRMD